MNNKKKAWEAILYSTAGIAAMLVVVIAVNVLATAAKTRLDLTQENLYTLSKGTRAILAKLDTPVKIRFYYTQSENELPMAFKTYARRVEDLLAEYKQLGKGKVIIEKYDPKPDSEAEDSANLDGVTGQMINTGEKIYLGLAVSCVDAKASIPFLAPERERLLEYDITRALANVINPTKPVVGVMSPLPVFGMPMNPMMMRMGQQGGQEPWLFISELKSDFTVQQVDMTAETIPDEVKVLVVFFPKDISDKTQYALDQFILRGGKLIAFLDPHSIVDNRNAGANPMQRMTAAGASLDRLLPAWGIQFDATKVVADLDFATRINRGVGRAELAPGVLSLTSEGMNTNDVVTSQIDNLLLAFPGAFTGTPVAGLTQTVLMKSSPNSQLVEKFMAEASSDQLTKNFAPSGKAQTLALRLTGKFKTAFPEGKPKDKSPPVPDPDNPAAKDKAEPAAEASLKESTSENMVALIGDTDLLYDQFCAEVGNFLGQRVVSLRNGNLPFLQNLVEQAAGDINLISIRSRSTMTRPFTVMKKMQAQAEETYRSRIKELEDKLQSTQARLNELQQKKEGNQRFVLSHEQQEEIKKFTEEQAKFRKDLKDLRKQLRERIDSIENRIKWTNIAAMPLLVTLSGISLAIIKRKKTSAK